MNISRLPKRLFGLISKKISCSGNMTIITGASSDFYESLRKNLLESIIRYENAANIIIWNLGLDVSQIADLQRFAENRGGGWGKNH